MTVHGGLVARRSAGAWRGVLIEGPSGSGKSDLALRLLAAGWTLVADDRVLVWSSGGRLYGRSPDALRDLMEIRGLGVVPQPALPFAEIVAIVQAVPSPERMPEVSHRVLADVTVPVLALNLLEPAAAPKLARAFDLRVGGLSIGDAASPFGVCTR